MQRMTITKPQTQFLELLKSGLWDTKIDHELFRGEVNWEAVLRIAKEQTVAVFVTDGIEKLPSDLWPTKNTMLKLMMLRIKTSQMHSLLNSTIRQIIEALDAVGIPSVLLKGQGVAQNYHKPENRTCGDIDIYTGVDGYEKACSVIKSLNKDSKVCGLECEYHMNLCLNGVVVEVHRFAGLMMGDRMNTSFIRWTQESIDSRFNNSGLLVWNNNDTKVNLPSPTFDAFFILHHAVRHMIKEGIGFRQICDWTMYLYKHHADIDCVELQRRLKEYKMETVWREFSIFAVQVLGLPVDKLPIMPLSHESSKTSKILKHIFVSGNFGRFDTNRRDYSRVSYFRRKWRSFHYQTLRLCKLFILFPRYTSSYMWHWMTGAIKRVLLGTDRK